MAVINKKGHSYEESSVAYRSRNVGRERTQHIP